MGSSAISIDEVVEELMRLNKSLPARPGIEEVEAAKVLIQNVDKEVQMRLESISKQIKRKDVPEELFAILQLMQRNLVEFQSKEQKREAVKLLDLENAHCVFDELIQRASNCLSSNSKAFTSSPAIATTASTSSSSFYSEKQPVKVVSKDDSYLKNPITTFQIDGVGVGLRSGAFQMDGIGAGLRSGAPDTSSTPQIVDSTLKPSTGQGGEKMSLIKLASLIEVSAKKGTKELILGGKLSDQVEWLPDSLGKLSNLITLDLSENHIAVLPTTIGGLSSLQKLDLHGNRIIQLPDSIGDLLNLVYLDLNGNSLKSLPLTLTRLTNLQELNLSSNSLSVLPETLGSMLSLKKLIVETNNIEELPHTIGQCTSLKELCADYNRIKALPEAVGRIGSLEILSVRYNNIRQLPTTMSSLTNLKELNISFNELESVPESLCFATTLVKLNVSNNFADLRTLPKSIGNLEMLEELDMSNNQIRFLPDSFRMLSHLRVLKTDGNPLEVPPGNVVAMGAQAVVQYMAELADKRDVKPQPVKQKKSWAQICFFSRSNKRKRNGSDYVTA